MQRRGFLLLSAASAISAGARGAAAQDTAAAFYAGERIRWIVPNRPGGGSDQYTRLIAPFFETYTGSRVEIVNMPGAGSMKGAVEVFRSPATGLHIGIMNGSALVANALAGAEGADYDVAAYSYIGRIAAEERVLLVSAGSGLRSLDDIRNAPAPVVFGATGRGGSSYVDAVIAGHVFGLPLRVIDGFDSSADLHLAMLRGDVAAIWGSAGSSAEGIVAGDLLPVLKTGNGADPLLAGTPVVADFSPSFGPEAAALVAGWLALIEVGRPLLGPPGIPADRLAFLREALRQSMADPAFVAQSGSAARELAYLGGAETLAAVRRALAVDAGTRRVLVAAITGHGTI